MPIKKYWSKLSKITNTMVKIMMMFKME